MLDRLRTRHPGVEDRPDRPPWVGDESAWPSKGDVLVSSVAENKRREMVYLMAVELMRCESRDVLRSEVGKYKS